MLSRRDKLLIRPWQQRKYENHLRKVQSALPAIDNRPPATRDHVAVKLKRKQNENERCTRIQKDNLILLQKLNYIMRTNRVDNYWSTPQPNFLNRVGIYTMTPKEQQRLKTERSQDFNKEITRIRTAKCLACTPQTIPAPPIPEERVPWEPEKAPVGRIRSKSVPAQRLTMLPTVKEIPTSTPTTPEEIKPQKPLKERSRSSKTHYNKKNLDENISVKSPQSIILSRGSLVLAVNFPSDTFVKFQEGQSEKFIMRGLCQCKNATKKFVKTNYEKRLNCF